jgi:formate dehydrogenase subunit gamma
MAVTIRRPDQALLRFDRVERAVHWVNATLFGVLIFTGAVLYLEPLQSLVGRRALVENIHLYCGLALPFPMVAAIAGPWGKALRRDLRRFNRFSADDRKWLRLLTRPAAVRAKQMKKLRLGKFNAGQKLNAAFVAGAGLVMLGTGTIMKWYHPWPLNWRTGATFVHDWLALAVGVVIVGHVMMAVNERAALGAMLRGTISRSWAQKHAPEWLAEYDLEE